MTQPSPRHEPAVPAGLDTALAVRDKLAGVTNTPRVDSHEFRGQLARIAALPADTLTSLAAFGHIVTVDATHEDLTVTVQFDGASALITVDGDAESALTATAADDLRRADLRGDAEAVLRAAAYLPATVTVRLRHPAGKASNHWVLDETALLTILDGPGWVAAARALDQAPHWLVVGDWTTQTVTTAGLIITGTEPPSRVRTPPTDLAPYTDPDGRPALPTPRRFADVAGSGSPNLGGVRYRLTGLARVLSWYWLASRADLTGDGAVALEVTGARTVRFKLTPKPTPHAAAEVALAEWAHAGADPARLESARQAASLAITTEADVGTAAEPALRTAKSLYELVRRGAVSEALSARRSGRDAAASAARQAAAAARQAAAKTVERLLVQVGAVAAIILSRAGDLLSVGAAVAVIALIVAASATSWAATVLLDLRSAKAGLTSDLTDLNAYRDTLSQDDVEGLKSSEAARQAYKDLDRTRRAVHGIYGAALAVTVATALVLVSQGPGTSAARNEPTSTSTPAP